MTRHQRALVFGCSLAAVGLLTAASPAWSQTVAPPQAPAVDTPATAVVSPLPSVSDIFTETVADLRGLPSRRAFTWLSVGIAASAIVHAEDARVAKNLSGSNRLDGTFASGATIGGVPAQLGGALATYAVGRLSNNRRVATIGADLVRAQLVSQAVT